MEAISRRSPTADGQITGRITNLYNGPRCIQIAVLLHHGTEAVKVSETAERPTSDIKREDYRDQQAQPAQPDETVVHRPLPAGPLQLVATVSGTKLLLFGALQLLQVNVQLYVAEMTQPEQANPEWMDRDHEQAKKRINCIGQTEQTFTYALRCVGSEVKETSYDRQNRRTHLVRQALHPDDFAKTLIREGWAMTLMMICSLSKDLKIKKALLGMMAELGPHLFHTENTDEEM